MLSLKISLRDFSINVFASLAGPVIMRFLFLLLPSSSQFHWEEELPWHNVTTDQNNLQYSQKSNVSSLYRLEMFAGFQFFFGWLYLPSFGFKLTDCFCISFKYKLSNAHLASSPPLLSNSKGLSVAFHIPFSNELC